ncbi:MAG: hypothetical protein N3E43_00040 [Sulfolobales archaeon]|nr:hypothetical protein [Sulfolobales archaeon]
MTFKSVAALVVAHKIRVRDEYEVEGITPESLTEETLNKIPIPKQLP